MWLLQDDKVSLEMLQDPKHPNPVNHGLTEYQGFRVMTSNETPTPKTFSSE